MATDPVPVTSNPDALPEPDELDKEQIEQLHAALLQIGGNCFELKKLCATVLIAAGTLVAAFTDKKLDTSVFVSGLCIVLVFWAADSQSYYYQAKIRRRMKKLEQKRVARHAVLAGYPVEGVGLPIDDVTGHGRTVAIAFLNWSMMYYGLIVILIALAWFVFALGVIS